MTLDDIDWRVGLLRIRQTKTRQTLRLPLTDEAAHVLIDYLRNARPESTLRQLFLRVRAPFTPLQPASVLAAYLGHVSAVSTHHYLKLTPELRQAASNRFHQRFAPLFVKGGIA